MKKIIHGLLGAMLLVSSAGAADKSNRSFLTARDSIGDNALMNASVSAANCNKKGMIGADVSVTGYYRRSHNTAEVGKYFGAGNGTGTTAPAGKIIVTGDTKNLSVADTHVFGAAIERVPTTMPQAGGDSNHAMGGTVTFAPVREEYGAHLAWNQDMGRIMDGLSFSVSAPVVGVRSHMNMKIEESVASAADNAVGGRGKDLKDFMSGLSLGKIVSVGAGQQELTHAKVAWQKVQDTKFAIADVRASLGWQFLKEADYNVSASANVVVPTGTTPTGEFLCEPVAGNGKHFGLGASLNSVFNLWRSDDKKSCLDFNAGVDYTYFFRAGQRRVLNVWDHVNSRLVDAGIYRATIRHGASTSKPAANELVTDVTVTPGSQVDANAGVAYLWNQWSFDASYNLHYREEETVKMKNPLGWTNNRLGYVGYRFKTTGTSAVVGKSATAVESGFAADSAWNAGQHTIGGPIQRDGVTTGTQSDTAGSPLTAPNEARYHISTKGCTTPSQLTHKVGGSFGYQFNTAKPVRVGMGGEYEVGSNNDSVASWAIWAKVGFCF